MSTTLVPVQVLHAAQAGALTVAEKVPAPHGAHTLSVVLVGALVWKVPAAHGVAAAQIWSVVPEPDVWMYWAAVQGVHAVQAGALPVAEN